MLLYTGYIVSIVIPLYILLCCLIVFNGFLMVRRSSYLYCFYIKNLFAYYIYTSYYCINKLTYNNMETILNKQVLKNGLLEFTKSTVGNTNDIFTVRFSNGSYNIYNGLILKSECYNINYAIKHCKVSSSSIKKDEVYIINTVKDNQKQIFGL